MKKIIMIMSLILLSVSSALAQKAVIYTFDINGVEYGKKYTDAQMRQFFGQPTESYVGGDVAPGEDFQSIYRYYDSVKKVYDYIGHSSVLGLNDFAIYTTRFKLYGGRVKVGDFINVFQKLGGGLLVGVKWGEYKFFHMGVETDEYLEVETDSLGRITCLSIHVPN